MWQLVNLFDWLNIRYFSAPTGNCCQTSNIKCINLLFKVLTTTFWTYAKSPVNFSSSCFLWAVKCSEAVCTFSLLTWVPKYGKEIKLCSRQLPWIIYLSYLLPSYELWLQNHRTTNRMSILCKSIGTSGFSTALPELQITHLSVWVE